MSLALKRDEDIPHGVRRIVSARIESALKSLTGDGIAVSDSAVHEARKRFREIRGILRLVRGELGPKLYRRENRTFRDLARPLAAVRDATVLVDALDHLVEHFEGRVQPDSLARVRRALLDRGRAVRAQVIEQGRAVSDITPRLEAAHVRVKDWPIHRRGWKAIGGGLRRVYARGRRAMEDVRAKRSNESLHEWRKRTKDLRYELELLQSIWPGTIAPLVKQAHRLADLLGDDHDLVVLQAVAGDPAAGASPVDRALLETLVAERRGALQREAIALGAKVYDERPRDFARRLRGYWKVTRRHTRAQRTRTGHGSVDGPAVTAPPVPTQTGEADTRAK